MKTLYAFLVSILLVCAITTLCIAQTKQTSKGWVWARSVGSNDEVNSIATDTVGNVYVAAHFYGKSVTLGKTLLVNSDSTPNTWVTYLVKYDHAGNTIWAKSIGGNCNVTVSSITTDVYGNIYMVGSLSGGMAYFGTTTLYGGVYSSSVAAFVAKYDANGNVLWAKGAGGLNADEAASVAADASGNVYVAGSFTSPLIAFDTFGLTNSNYYVNNNWVLNLFFVKYDKNGNVIWVKGADKQASSTASNVKIDTSGNIYLMGGFAGLYITFGYDTLSTTNQYYEGFYINKYSPDGKILRSIFYSNDIGFETVDAFGNIYLAGYFKSDSIILGNTTLKYIDTVGSTNMFLAKCDTIGNPIWVKRGWGYTADNGIIATADVYGNVYVTGEFTNPSFTFDTITLMNMGKSCMYLCKYNANGDILWAKSPTNNNNNQTGPICTDVSGNIYVAGEFGNSSITFGTTTLPVTGTQDVFLAKIGTVEDTTIVPSVNTPFFNIYPNPTVGQFTIIVPNSNAEVIITDAIGREIFHTTVSAEKTNFDIRHTGMYFVRVQTAGQSVTRKLIVVK